MGEIEALKAIADAFEKLEADERARVLAWAQSKYGGAPATIVKPAPQVNTAHQTPGAAPIIPSKAKSSKKAKSVISMDKTLNLSPQGKQSAAQFAQVKAPSNVREKCVVAVFYLRDVIALEKVTVQAVFTFFKSVQWPAPADLKNTLQQAGSAGWLDTADSDDIKLTSLGENLVEHDLPAKPKA
ncbi:MAG: hypothetical protein QOD40_3369 [Alphaproteobacteria bacterium]|nr:hypothetical protein [Alphaproteobacteria bacterium]